MTAFNTAVNAKELQRWLKIRRQRLLIDNFTCQVCAFQDPSGAEIEIHHRTYVRCPRHSARVNSSCTGKEDVQHDLIALCKAHHDAITNKDRERRRLAKAPRVVEYAQEMPSSARRVSSGGQAPLVVDYVDTTPKRNNRR